MHLISFCHVNFGNRPLSQHFPLLTSGQRYWVSCAETNTHRNRFYPVAIKYLHQWGQQLFELSLLSQHTALSICLFPQTPSFICLLPMKAAQCSARPSFLSKALMLAPLVRRRFTIWQRKTQGGERIRAIYLCLYVCMCVQEAHYVWAWMFVSVWGCVCVSMCVCVCVCGRWSLYNSIVNTSRQLAQLLHKHSGETSPGRNRVHSVQPQESAASHC